MFSESSLIRSLNIVLLENSSLPDFCNMTRTLLDNIQPSSRSQVALPFYRQLLDQPVLQQSLQATKHYERRLAATKTTAISNSDASTFDRHSFTSTSTGRTK